MKLPVRQPVARGSVRRSRRTPASWLARAFGLVVVVAVAGAMYWLNVSDTFRLDAANVHVSGLLYTDAEQVRETVGLAGDARPNVFRLRPAQMAEALRGLPSVESAEVEIRLPDELDIAVHERQPLLIWRTAGGSFLVDAAGAIVAAAPTGASFPALDDRRAAARDLAPGDRLDATDMAAARLLLTIAPADLGSASTGLSLAIDDQNGWYIDSAAPPWRAVFGFYTANQLPPAQRIPRQRQCLESLLAARSEQAVTIYLAVDGDRCGTFREEPTPAGYSVQNVGRRAP